MRRKKKKKVEEPKTMIGQIIDLPLEDFKEELVRQQVNIGTINNLILNLEGAYNELRVRKDQILKMVFENKLDIKDPTVDKAFNGIYAEMTKLEIKISYLKEYVKELVNVG